MKSVLFIAISINMLISIMNSVLKLLLLPLLLIISFGIPLYLLFHQVVNIFVCVCVCVCVCVYFLQYNNYVDHFSLSQNKNCVNTLLEYIIVFVHMHII